VDNLVGERIITAPPPSTAQSSIIEVPQKKAAVYKSISIQTSQDELIEKTEKITYNKSTQTYEGSNEDSDEEPTKDENDSEKDDDVKIDTASEQNVIVEEIQNPIAEVDELLLTNFFNKSLKIINRVMKEEDDILKSYKDVKRDTEVESTDYGELFSLKLDHGIYSIDTSAFFPELLALSTDKKVIIYNSLFKKIEYQFTTATKILTVQFSKLNSNIIFGTGYNGKIFCWNLESESNIPYLVSSANTMNHSYPVFALSQIHENNGTLITASTDGKICTWSSSMLSKPMSPPIELKTPKSLSLRFDELAPTSILNLPNDHGFVIIGCEDGNIYRVKRFDNKVSANTDDLFDRIYQKHQGPISSLDSSAEFPNLFISSSFDWNVFLWDLNSPEEPLLKVSRNNSIIQASWRPGNSTQIGFIYGNVFEILDLSIDSVKPIIKITVEKTLNSFRFDKSGVKVILGSVDGEVKGFEILLKDVKQELGRFKRLYIKS